jgi:hypothetical protein
LADTGERAFEAVSAAFSPDRQVSCEPGWGAGNLVLKVRGRIFAMLVRGSLVVKLPKERVAGLVADRTGTPFDAGKGRPMKEWIVVRPGRASWIELSREAHRFVRAGR